jgi:Flp pilus assembly protein TadD
MSRNIPLGRLAFAAVAVVVALSAVPALAQQGVVRGTVVDGTGKPIEGAQILIEFTGGVNRRFETKSNAKGEFMQIGLPFGNYRVTAQLENVGTDSLDLRVGGGPPQNLEFILTPATPTGRPMSREEAEKMAAFKTVYGEATAASDAGNHDLAITKFTEALAVDPACFACQYNIGGAYAQKKDFARAEEAYKKAMTMQPDAAEPYSALANLYNTQRRFDDAATMSAEASKRATTAGGANAPEQVYNQGVILWNAGKIAEAKAQFTAALQAKPDLADAHYWLGMANLNEGNMSDAASHFDQYLKLAPTGQYAQQAQGIMSQLKK